jgi:PEP-CTERM motif-containing protein
VVFGTIGVGEDAMKAKALSGSLLLFLLLFAARMNAGTIQLDSLGTAADAGQTNSNGNTIAIAPNALWAAALPSSSWVSFGKTGDTSNPGFFVVLNGTVVSFFDVFNISGIPSGGQITVMADDAVTVILNDVTLMAEAPISGNTYKICSDFGIGCRAPSVIDIPASDLNQGSNTLDFEVAQRNGVSFGLDYSGYITDPVVAPEPSTAMLLGLGLLAIATLGASRKSANIPA